MWGVGFVANADPGFPGYAGELPHNQQTLAEMLKASGYATMAVGKWHPVQGDRPVDCRRHPLVAAPAGLSTSSTGFLEALTNFHHPHLMYEGNSPIDIAEYPEGYYLTDDLTDRACRMIREVKATDPDKPFFLYYAHGAVHAPLHAKADDIARHRGNYDKGWDQLREERLARQIELGVVPPDTELPPRNFEPDEDVRAWDSYSEGERRVMARYMEVYAAMVESIDDSVAAIRAELEAVGQLDNTIFVFTSDNGASREGRAQGTTSYFTYSNPGAMSSAEVGEEEMNALDAIGGPTTWPHYPRGWAMACNTPLPAVQDHVVPGRPLGAVRAVVAGPHRGGGRGAAPPVRPHHRPAAHPGRVLGPRYPRRAQRPGLRGARRRVVRGHRGRRRRAIRPHRAVLRMHRPPGLLPRRLGRGCIPRVHDPVQHRPLGAVQPDRRPQRADRPWPRPSPRS